MVLDGRPAIVLSAHTLQAGQGGIGRVARLTLRVLARAAKTTAFAVNDESHMVADTPVAGFRGSRAAFLAAHNLALLRANGAIYDFAGTARAHLIRSRRYILWVHGNEIWDQPVVRPDYARAIRRADLIIANSQTTASALRAAIADSPPIHVCLLSTESADGDRASSAMDDGVPTASIDPTLMLVGRNDSGFPKGQDILIRLWPQVIAALPKARLVFAGGGAALPELRKMAADSPASRNISVLGFVPEHEMSGLWRQAQASVLLSSLEGFGLVIVEAMRHGLPVICSQQDAGQEIVRHGLTGFCVDRSDTNAVLVAILDLLGDRRLSRSLGEEGRRHWRTRYHPDVFAERLDLVLSPWLRSL
jgi:phosphatidyl-myo-inositol dimannoside synthase